MGRTAQRITKSSGHPFDVRCWLLFEYVHVEQELARKGQIWGYTLLYFFAVLA